MEATLGSVPSYACEEMAKTLCRKGCFGGKKRLGSFLRSFLATPLLLKPHMVSKCGKLGIEKAISIRGSYRQVGGGN